MGTPHPLPHLAGALSLDVAPDGRVAVARHNRLWLAPDRHRLTELTPLFPDWEGPVRYVRWLGGGRLAWSLWPDSPLGDTLHHGDPQAGTWQAAGDGGPLSAGGGLLAVGGAQPRVLDADGAALWVGGADVTALALAPDGDHLAAARRGDDGALVELFALADPAVPLLQLPDAAIVTGLGVAAGGRQLVWRTGDPFDSLRFWHADAEEVDESLFVVDCEAIRFLADGSLVLAARSGHVGVHRATNGLVDPTAGTLVQVGSHVYDLALDGATALVAADPAPVTLDLDA